MAIQNRIVVGSGGGSLDGVTIYFADESMIFIPFTEILENYNPDDPDNHVNWFVIFLVDFARLDQLNITYSNFNPDGFTNLYDGDAANGEAQTFFCLPIYLNEIRVNFGGVYRENIRCAGSKGPIVELLGA